MVIDGGTTGAQYFCALTFLSATHQMIGLWVPNLQVCCRDLATLAQCLYWWPPGWHALYLSFPSSATGPSSSLSALSLGGCSLADRDLGLLTDALQQGLPLRMLKLSGNRISGKGIPRLVEALLAQPAPPLKLIDLANNQVCQKCYLIVAWWRYMAT